MFIVYANFGEAIVCTDSTEKETLRTYFDEGGRDVEDYGCDEFTNEAVRIIPSVLID